MWLIWYHVEISNVFLAYKSRQSIVVLYLSLSFSFLQEHFVEKDIK